MSVKNPDLEEALYAAQQWHEIESLDGLGFGDLRKKITAMIGGHDDE